MKLVTKLKKPKVYINNILTEGLTVITAPPKSGKTTLALQIAVAVAEGKSFMGENACKGTVLYYSEYGEKDIAGKINSIPAGFHICCEPCLGEIIEDGFTEDILVVDGLDRYSPGIQKEILMDFSGTKKTVILVKHITEDHPWKDVADTVITLGGICERKIEIIGENIDEHNY